jgi:hypothetical protein
MKNLNTLLIVLIVLSGLGFGLAFFVLKKKKKSEVEPIQSTTKETDNTPTELPSLGQNLAIDPSRLSDISIPHVDTLNRRFEFSMNYSGIAHKGEFIEGKTYPPFIKKSFGTFRIQQRAPEVKIITISNDDKIRGGATSITNKGGATASMDVPIPKYSDWVDLEIRDTKNTLLNALAVNLATGATIGTLTAH